MTEPLQHDALRGIFSGAFREEYLKREAQAWRQRYVGHVRRIRDASRDEWIRPEFQKALWEDSAVSTIGPGQTVTVVGAYGDAELAAMLLDARDHPPTGTPFERGQTLQALYDKTMAHVYPRYTSRRPRARLVRLLTAVFPGEMTCLMDARRTWQVQRLIGATKIEADFVGQNPSIRAQLRAVLGEFTSPEETVDQAIFTWFLWETYCKRPDQGAVEVAGPEKRSSDLPSFSLLPPASQRRSPTCVRDNVGLLVAVVREAEQGIARSDLVSAIQREAPQLSQSSASIIISQAQGGLGLVQLGGGAFRPTERGVELLNAPDPAEVLRAPLVGRFFGMGHLLLLLQSSPGGLPQQEVAKRVSATCSTWTTSRPGQELIQWALATGLARQMSEGGVLKLALTEDGEDYAAALPADFEEKWRLDLGLAAAAQDGPAPADSTSTPHPAALQPVPWPLFREHFRSGPLSSTLILGDDRLAELHAALHASDRKRFVLLAGLSGTGKTLLARAYAEAYCRARGLDPSQHHLQIAVRPDWTDPTGLLGYVNALTDPPSYQSTGTLGLLLRANERPDQPFFLCLDEMNLARVEHYFAPFLSAMEGAGGWLELHGEREAVDIVDPRIPWPRNLFIFGTVNMDESTHAFSDKVLDRAFTFEFWDVDLSAWERRKREAGDSVPVLIDRLAPLLRRAYDVLRPARRHFGYRTADEFLAFCKAVDGSVDITSSLDTAFLTKVLPRVRGDDAGPLEAALKDLAKLASDQGLARSGEKIRAMLDTLRSQGHARFWS